MPPFNRFTPICLALALAFTAQARAQSSQDPLKTLRPAHPRLILLDADIPAIKATIANDPFAAEQFSELQRRGDAMLSKPVNPYKLDGNEHNLLNTARAVEDTILTCAGLYRLTGQRKFADRATAEMLSAASFPDWNPKHFLETGEMTAALGLGYDWLYPILTPKERGAIHAAIVLKGLDPWLQSTGGEPDSSGIKQFHMLNNWMQVCVGGETLGALAVADEEPARARIVIDNSQAQIRSVMKFFAPDGGFDEGPVYWSYATSYNVLYLAALDSALGTDFGLSQMPGFSDTGNYRIQVLGPTWMPANFGDAHDTIYRSPQMFWMATKFNKPEYAVAERRIDQAYLPIPHHNANESDRFIIFTLTYYRTPANADADPPTVAGFQHSGLAFLRSDWSISGKPDTNAFFIGLKGGVASTNHGHLDMGSFVLDALGERWALDLGPDNYGLPRYNDIHSPERWSYLRASTEGHNTLTIDGANESLDTDAKLAAVGQSPSGFPKYAVLDLDSAYKDHLKHWQRGVEILSGPRILVQDELTPSGNADILWRILTHADAKPGHDPSDVTLTLNGKKLRLHILSPSGAQFATRAHTNPPSPQEPTTGINEVSIHLPKLSTPTTLAVLFSAEDDKSPTPTLPPLSQWSTSTKAPQ